MSDAFFVTCRDGDKASYLLGPFTTEKACKIFAQFKENNPDSKLSEVQEDCFKIDPRSHFYSWGMCRVRDFIPCEITGVLNKHNPKKWDKVLS